MKTLTIKRALMFILSDIRKMLAKEEEIEDFDRLQKELLKEPHSFKDLMDIWEDNYPLSKDSKIGEGKLALLLLLMVNMSRSADDLKEVEGRIGNTNYQSLIHDAIVNKAKTLDLDDEKLSDILNPIT